MQMINRLLLYSISNFTYIKDYYSSLGKTIVSVGEFIGSDVYINKLTIDYDDCLTVIDLSYFCSMKDKLQFFGENLINKLKNHNYEYICDSKYANEVQIELRFCFNTFDKWEDVYEINFKSIISKEAIKKHIKVTDLNESEFKDFLAKFRDSLYGHDRFKDEFTNLLKSFRVFNALGEHKVLSLFLLGESGVGKTEVARAIYNSLGGKTTLAKVNFGNYSNEFSLSSLIGSARGYIGSDDGEIFIRVRNTDVGVILIDEFEKSNAALFNFFLDVLESGKIVSSQAEELNINGFIIVFTSNISKEDFPNRISPELRSRFDYKGRFTRLFEEDKIKYIEFRVKSIINKYNNAFQDNLNNDVLEFISSKINVNQYHNMRDINKRIKSEFINYLEHTKNTPTESKSKFKELLRNPLPD